MRSRQKDNFLRGVVASYSIDAPYSGSAIPRTTGQSPTSLKTRSCSHTANSLKSAPAVQRLDTVVLPCSPICLTRNRCSFRSSKCIPTKGAIEADSFLLLTILLSLISISIVLPHPSPFPFPLSLFPFLPFSAASYTYTKNGYVCMQSIPLPKKNYLYVPCLTAVARPLFQCKLTAASDNSTFNVLITQTIITKTHYRERQYMCHYFLSKSTFQIPLSLSRHII